MKFNTPYVRSQPFQPEKNSGERKTDASINVSAKEMFYRIMNGEIVSPYRKEDAHYDTHDYKDGQDIETKEFEDDIPDLVDYKNELDAVNSKISVDIASETTRRKQEYDNEIIEQAKKSFFSPSTASTSQSGDEDSTSVKN